MSASQQRPQSQDGTNSRPTDDGHGRPSRRRRQHAGRMDSGLSFDSGSEGGQLIQALNKSQVPEDIKRLLEAELNQDHILGNLNEAELNFRRFSILNNMEIVLASHPPAESVWQGGLRKEAGLGDGRKALTPEQIHWIRDAFDAAYERTTRSREGWQQRLLSEQQQERRVVEERPQERRSWLDRILG